ncbi:MAG: MFS transporter [Candidatus Firestonebacteria bacterium]
MLWLKDFLEKAKKMVENEVKTEIGKLHRKVYADFLWEVVFGIIQFVLIVPGGIFLTGYLLLMGANNTQIGFISSIPVLVNIIAPFASFLVERAESKKTISLRLILPTKFLWIIVSLIPLLIYYNGISYPIIFFISVYTLISLVSAPANIAWINWMGDIIPEKERGYYFGRRSIIAGLIAVIVSFLLGRYLDKVPEKHIGFSVVYGIGAIAGFLSYYMLMRLPDTKNISPGKDKFSMKFILKKIQKVFTDKNFMNLVWFNVVWAFSLSFIGVFLNVFMFKELKMSYTLIVSFAIISTLANLALTPFWGRIADKYGNKPVMLICGNVLGFTPFLWAVTMPSNYFVIIPLLYIMAGIAWAGFNIAAFNIVLKLAPKEDRAFFLSVNMLLPSITAFIAPLISGFLIDTIGTYRIDMGFYYFGAFQLVFLLGAFMRSLPLRILKKVIEPQEEHVEKVMRSVKTGIAGGFAEGIGVLFNYAVMPVTFSGTLVEKLIKRKDADWYHCNLNILQIVSSGAFKVKERSVINLSKQLAAGGQKVVIAAKKGTAIYDKAAQEGFTVYNIDIGMRPNLFKIYKLYKIIFKHKIHIIHSHSTTDLLNIILASRFAGRVPIVLSKYTYTSGVQMDLVTTWMFANVSRVIASKEFFRKNLIETLPVLPKHTVTVYSGLDLKDYWLPGKYREETRKSLGILENEKAVTLVARINESKGQMTLVEAAPFILKTLPETKFILVGGLQTREDEEYKAKLIIRLQELKIQDRFIFTGFRPDIGAVVDASDLIVSCTLFETSGITLIQGMAMEKPVVGTKGGGAEIICDRINGRVFPYGDHIKLAEAVAGILKTKNKAGEMGKYGRKIAEEIFSLDKMTLQIENIYRHIRE